MADLKRVGMHTPHGRYRSLGYAQSREEAEQMCAEAQKEGNVRATVIEPIRLKTKTKYKVGVYRI